MIAVNGTIKSVNGHTVVVAIRVGNKNQQFELPARNCKRVHIVHQRPTFRQKRRRAIDVGTPVLLQLGKKGGQTRVLAWGLDPRNRKVSSRPLAGQSSRRLTRVLNQLVA